jgi:aryl-alcohol dehydrogenase-like predicted oxidoreductase
MSDTVGGLQLGLGLVSLGRTWGVHGGQPPSELAAHDLIVGAVGLGITFFDTAPAYGASEALLGRALASLRSPRNRLTIATKMGEHWVDHNSPTVVDHSYDTLCRSLDRSIERLGRIDVLLIHKATSDNLVSGDVTKAMAYARSLGISRFGASISDIATAEAAMASGQFESLQFPFNAQSTQFAALFPLLAAKAMTPITNRPLAMGAAVQVPASDKPAAIRQALQLIQTQCQQAGCQHAIIITGTRHVAHLAETLAAYKSLAAG